MSTPIEIIDDLRRRRLTVHSPLSHDEFVTWFAELVDQGKEVDAEDSEALVEACLHVFADGRLRFRLFAAVVRVEGWQRGEYFDETGLEWVNPSPNMRSLTEAILYPAIGLLETTNLSVGRGTPTPFELFGAPWIDRQKLADTLNALNLPGVRFEPIEFIPDASVFEGKRCQGVRVQLVDRDAFQTVRTGLEIARQLRLLYPDAWEAEKYDRLLGNRQVLDALLAGKTVAEIEILYQPELDAFLKRRAEHLLYQQ